MRGSPPRLRSLAKRLRLLMIAVFGLGTIVALAASWVFAGLAADEADDRLLESAAVQIVDMVDHANGRYVVSPPDSAFDTLALSPDDRFFYAVRAPDGSLLTGYDDLPAARGSTTLSGATVQNARYAGAVVRLLTLRRFFGQTEGQGAVSVTVAETRIAHDAMRRRLFARSAPTTIAISIFSLFVSLAAGRLAVGPLAALERALASRQPQDLTPVDIAGPRETEALVAAINTLMERAETRLTQLQQFSALAAHQLRTPLTALSAQMDLLAHDRNEDDRAARIERIRARIGEFNRLIHQLLGHAMIAYRGESVPRRPVDLVAIARQAAANDLPYLASEDIEIEVRAPRSAILPGDDVMLREAVTNLVANAALHGARHLVQIEVAQDGAGVSILVADDGPGVPPHLWAEAGQPFAARSVAGGGAGLGLSIVRQTAEAHGGRLILGRGGDGLFHVGMQFPHGEPGA